MHLTHICSIFLQNEFQSLLMVWLQFIISTTGWLLFGVGVFGIVLYVLLFIMKMMNEGKIFNPFGGVYEGNPAFPRLKVYTNST